MARFVIANLCDDLVEHTIMMCGKVRDNLDNDVSEKGPKTLRFPKHLYDDIIPEVKLTAANILKNVVIANHTKDLTKRLELQEEALGLCVYLNHLIMIFKRLGYISSKQRDFWQKKITNIEIKITNWITSDKNRFNS